MIPARFSCLFRASARESVQPVNSSGFHGGFINTSCPEYTLSAMKQPLNENPVKSSAMNLVIGLSLVAIGVAIGAAGIHIGDTDDAPGAALMGIGLMIAAVAFGVRTMRRKT